MRHCLRAAGAARCARRKVWRPSGYCNTATALRREQHEHPPRTRARAHTHMCVRPHTERASESARERCVRVCARARTRTRLRARTHTCVRAPMRAHTPARSHACRPVCAHGRAGVCARAHTQTLMCARMREREREREREMERDRDCAGHITHEHACAPTCVCGRACACLQAYNHVCARVRGLCM